MSLFKKKKVIAEEPPGFPELKKEIQPIQEIQEESSFNEIKMPESAIEEETDNEKEIPELPKSKNKHEELPDIPGMEIINVNKPKLKQTKSAIPDLNKEKELPEKMSHDIAKVNENPAQFYKKSKEDREEKQIKHAQQRQERETNEDKSVFVKIEDFNTITFSLGEIKNKLKLIEDNISELKALKDKEDSEIRSWEREIMDIKERLINVDKVLSNKTN